VALGNLSIERNISRPVTDDPWLLNQLIHAVRRFYDVIPHSVHISLQLRSQHRPDRNRLLPVEMMHCLFAIAGDAAVDADGRLKIRRLVTDEIIAANRTPPMLFSEIAIRRSSDGDGLYPPVRAPDAGAGRYVQQFRFLRLSEALNYEPIAMALKGTQISLRPGTFLTPEQHKSSRRHRRIFEELLAWGAQPTPIPKRDIDDFLEQVQRGLVRERRGRPAHTGAYIAWSLNQLKEMLKSFNALAARCAPAEDGTPKAEIAESHRRR